MKKHYLSALIDLPGVAFAALIGSSSISLALYSLEIAGEKGDWKLLIAVAALCLIITAMAVTILFTVHSRIESIRREIARQASSDRSLLERHNRLMLDQAASELGELVLID